MGLLPDFGQNGKFYAFYVLNVLRLQRLTHVCVHTIRVTNFAFDTYPRKTHFERCTAQKLAQNERSERAGLGPARSLRSRAG